MKLHVAVAVAVGVGSVVLTVLGKRVGKSLTPKTKPLASFRSSDSTESAAHRKNPQEMEKNWHSKGLSYLSSKERQGN